MSAEFIFSVCNLLILPGWLLLAALPRWKWTLTLISAGVIPFILGLVYLGLVLSQLSAWPEGGGFGSAAAVAALFSNPYILTGGWVHYLAFDLFVGSWEVQDAQRHNIPHWMVVPCLVFTCLFGPVGLVLYLLLRAAVVRRFTIYDLAR